MAAMVHKAGTALATGATASGIAKTHTQTSGKNAAGELKFIFDESGADLAVYVTDPHKELSFEAVLESDYTDHDIGDLVTVGEGNSAVKYIVTQWNVTESNEDVKKVSIGLRPTTLNAPAAT